MRNLTMKTMRDFFEKHPLRSILLLAFFARLVAVLFSKGFGWHDDHFLVIEAAQSWADGSDYNDWLPGSNNNVSPTGHNWLYPGLHYLLFSLLNFIGLEHPQGKMYVVRFLHALYSLITVYASYRITEKLSGKETAKKTGLLMALYWFMPFLSVRNLVEIACIPPLMLGTWMLVRTAEDSEKKIRNAMLAGLLIGLAFSFRNQSSFMLIGTGMVLLLQKQWKLFIAFGAGAACSIAVIQGGIDLFIWGYPFAELAEYIRYNLATANDYQVNTWYSYLLLIGGMLIPPISIFIFSGFIRSAKKHLLLFLPSLLFILFHIVYPNKQERFILPVVPFIIMAGMIGWNELMNRSLFLQKRKNIIQGCWVFFWILNCILLPVISTMYSKQARVESMLWIYERDKKVDFLLVEDSNHETVKIPAEFYLGNWVGVFEVSKSKPVDSLRVYIRGLDKKYYPDYALFYEDKNLKARTDTLRTLFTELKQVAVIPPGFIDDLLYRLNPKNANQTVYIYKVTP